MASPQNPDQNQKTKNQSLAKPTDPQTLLIRKNARTGMMVMLVIVGMIILSFASVPLYRMICQTTGFDGSTRTATALPGKIIDRTVTIHFNADIDRHLPWDFKPEMPAIKVKMGQKGLAAFRAHNRADTPVTGTALYNVTPLKAGKYFHKIQCFCFGQQVLQPGQTVSMPVVFYVDPGMNEDPNMDDVNDITLSYTFFKADSNALEDALKAFYNEAVYGKR